MFLYSSDKISVVDKSISSYSDARNRFSGEINLIEQRRGQLRIISITVYSYTYIHMCSMPRSVYGFYRVKRLSARRTNGVAVPVSRQINQQYDIIHLDVRGFLSEINPAKMQQFFSFPRQFKRSMKNVAIFYSEQFLKKSKYNILNI